MLTGDLRRLMPDKAHLFGGAQLFGGAPLFGGARSFGGSGQAHRFLAEFLLDHGAAIDQPSGELHRNSPLGWAVVAGRPQMGEFLVERGATVEDFHMKDAEAGAERGFANWTDATRDDFLKIRDILNTSSR